MSSEDQSGFVRFAWGRSRLPPKAFWRVDMKLLRSNMSEESLPVGAQPDQMFVDMLYCVFQEIFVNIHP